jgi:hypothetical protein
VTFQPGSTERGYFDLVAVAALLHRDLIVIKRSTM